MLILTADLERGGVPDALAKDKRLSRQEDGGAWYRLQPTGVFKGVGVVLRQGGRYKAIYCAQQ